MVAGDVVNTASRLQSRRADERRSSSASRRIRATRHVIDYREHAPVEAKGKAEPVPVWEVVEAQRARRRRAARPGDAARRARARARPAARRRSSASAREPSTQLVTIVGVPGIGKSRLVAELYGELEREAELTNWRAGPLAAVRRGRRVLGVRRDGQGAGGHPRDRPRGRRRAQAARRASPRSLADEDAALGRGAAAAARRPRAARRARATRASPPGAASSRRSPSSGRPCSSSRTCTGRTTSCSTSSTSSSTGSTDVPLLVVATARPGAASSGGRAGEAASGTR